MARMNRQAFAISTVLLLSAMFPGCGLEGPRPNGDLVGISHLYDVNGTRVYDNSGITVTAEPTGIPVIVGLNRITAVSGADGRWVLPNLPMGTYTISASKAGYGTVKQMGYQFAGGGQSWLGEISICELPAFTVTGMSATPSSGGVTVSGTITEDARSNARLIFFFIGSTATVSSDPATYTSITGRGGGASTSFSYTLGRSEFSPFVTGQTVYLVAYGSNPTTFSYTDMATNRYWYASLNPTPSNVVSIVVP